MRQPPPRRARASDRRRPTSRRDRPGDKRRRLRERVPQRTHGRRAAPRAAPATNADRTRTGSRRLTPSRSARDFFRLGDHDVFLRHVLMEAAVGGVDSANAVDHVLAFDDLAEYAIAPAVGAWRFV